MTTAQAIQHFRQVAPGFALSQHRGHEEPGVQRGIAVREALNASGSWRAEVLPLEEQPELRAGRVGSFSAAIFIPVVNAWPARSDARDRSIASGNCSSNLSTPPRLGEAHHPERNHRGEQAGTGHQPPDADGGVDCERRRTRKPVVQRSSSRPTSAAGRSGRCLLQRRRQQVKRIRIASARRCCSTLSALSAGVGWPTAPVRDLRAPTSAASDRCSRSSGPATP